MDWFQRHMLDLKKEKDRKRALVFDGIGKYYQICNFCGKQDIVFPVSGLRLCPNCMKKGWWEPHNIEIQGSGFCDICGVHSIGAIAYVKHAMACWKCEWYVLGKQKHALRVQGRRIC